VTLRPGLCSGCARLAGFECGWNADRDIEPSIGHLSAMRLNVANRIPAGFGSERVPSIDHHRWVGQ
jgi:hypothetical protein